MKTYKFLNDLHFSVEVPAEKTEQFRELIIAKLQEVVYNADNDIDIIKDEPLNNIIAFDIFATLATNLTTDFLDSLQQILIENAIENYYE